MSCDDTPCSLSVYCVTLTPVEDLKIKSDIFAEISLFLWACICMKTKEFAAIAVIWEIPGCTNTHTHTQTQTCHGLPAVLFCLACRVIWPFVTASALPGLPVCRLQRSVICRYVTATDLLKIYSVDFKKILDINLPSSRPQEAHVKQLCFWGVPGWCQAEPSVQQGRTGCSVLKGRFTQKFTFCTIFTHSSSGISKCSSNCSKCPWMERLPRDRWTRISSNDSVSTNGMEIFSFC